MRGTLSSVGYLARSFDLINVHDLELIAQAGLHCSRLVVGVYSDDFVLGITGRAPIVPLAERLALVSHVRGVDEAIVHDAADLPAGPDLVVFVERDGKDHGPNAVVSLDAPRFTESAILREALEPVLASPIAEAVA